MLVFLCGVCTDGGGAANLANRGGHVIFIFTDGGKGHKYPAIIISWWCYLQYCYKIKVPYRRAPAPAPALWTISAPVFVENRFQDTFGELRAEA